MASLVKASELEVILSWVVVGVREAGVYKCEITYLTSNPCPVVRLISRLVVISPPTFVDLFTTRPQIRYSTIGPWGQQVRLGCVSRGDRVSLHPVSYTHLTLPTSDLV